MSIEFLRAPNCYLEVQNIFAIVIELGWNQNAFEIKLPLASNSFGKNPSSVLIGFGKQTSKTKEIHIHLFKLHYPFLSIFQCMKKLAISKNTPIHIQQFGPHQTVNNASTISLFSRSFVIWNSFWSVICQFNL